MTPSPIAPQHLAAAAFAAVSVSLFLAGLFAALTRYLRLGWAGPTAWAWGLFAVSFLRLALVPWRDSPALGAISTLALLAGHAFLAEGLWRFALPQLPRPRQYLALVGLCLGLPLAAWLTGLMSRTDALDALVPLWVMWAALFWRAGRIDGGAGPWLNMAACLSTPLLLAARALGVWPVVNDGPGMLPIVLLGVSTLSTGLVRAHRQAAQAEAKLVALNQGLERIVDERTAALRQTIDGLESFNRSVSHDIRGPVGAIRGAAALAREALHEGRTDLALRLLDAIERQAQESTAMADSLLTLARASNASFRGEPVALGPLVGDVVQALRDENRLGALQVEAAPLPTVHGDVQLLRQLFRNLLGNAAKFAGGADRPCVRVMVAEEQGQPVIVVADNGVGFAPEQAARVFEPFVRVHSGYEGSGIGLAIVKRIVERHHGWIRAESQPGQGARFVFSLGPAAG